MNQPYMDNNENLAVGSPLLPVEMEMEHPPIFPEKYPLRPQFWFSQFPNFVIFFQLKPVPPKLPIIGQPRQPSIKTSDSQVSGTPGHARSNASKGARKIRILGKSSS